MQINPNNNGGNKLLWFLLSTAISIVLLGAAAWGGYVNQSIAAIQDDVTELKTQYTAIQTKLDILIEETRRARRK